MYRPGVLDNYQFMAMHRESADNDWPRAAD
jgi:hypothetical protein